MGYLLNKLANVAFLRSSDIAVVDDIGTTSFGELADRVSRAADVMRANNCRRIAILANNGSDWIVADIAAMCADAVVVPIPPFFSPAQITHLIETACIDTVVALPEVLGSIINIEQFETLDCSALDLGLFSRRDSQSQIESTRLSRGKITYTSGSTGNPKGVILSGETIDLIVHRLATVFENIQAPRHLCSTPLAMLLENIAGVYVPLVRGSTVIAPSVERLGLYGSSRVDAQRFIRMLDDSCASSAILQPQVLRELTSAIQTQSTRRPEHLRFVAVGGAKVNDADLTAAKAAGIPAFQGYGLSECASVVAINLPGASRPDSVGKPLPGIDVQIADDGEILVSGQSMDGYLGEARSGDDVVHTGDLGHMDDDGFLFVTGRKKNVFITSFGRNVSPEWPESELLHEPEIAQACVFGEAKPNNTAVVVANDATDHASVAVAIARANLRLPDYAKVSSWLITDEPFSNKHGLLTPTGKLCRNAIAQHFLLEQEPSKSAESERFFQPIGPKSDFKVNTNEFV